jgi:gamma-glutamyltranspeptidase/glutathione hydrolase
VPVQFLTSKTYALERLLDFDATRARTSSSVKAGLPPPESQQTTHFSIADKEGNLVSTTTTLNLNFGSGWMASGTGVLLNNEMDDFSIKTGVPNAFGLLGSQANAIAPGKRPLSSMTPTILFRNGEPWIATGSPGGSRIITTVLQFVINVTDFSMNIAAASAVPRMHHQWLPDQLLMESGFSPDTIALLQAMGHDVRPSRAFGRLQSVAVDGGNQRGASDPRSGDGAAVGVID